MTDLIELARTQAISDALILSGDEDVRVGVQVAQGFGIRVHLVGIHPARGSQSPSLIAESDTHHEWGKTQVEQWLSVLAETPKLPVIAPQTAASQPKGENWIDNFTLSQANLLRPAEAKSILAFADENQNQLPADFDRPFLAEARSTIGRDLTYNERKAVRAAARAALLTRSNS